MRNAVTFAAAAAVTAAALYAGRQYVYARPQDVGPPLLEGELGEDGPSIADQARSVADAVLDFVAPAPVDTAANNLAAFLTAIATAEGTADGNGYRALYGHTPRRPVLFDSFADHPAELGWPGVRLSDEQCAGAGLSSGCVTTAAGRYQITRTTWRRLRAKLGRDALPDFSPASQDRAAQELIAERGALRDVQTGAVEAAIDKVRRIWASLPGAGYAGQPERSLPYVLAAYETAGGTLA